MTLLEPAHLAILAAVPAAAGALAAWARRRPGAARGTRVGFAAALAANEVARWSWAAAHGWISPPHGLPLQLCDVLVWLAAYALATDRRWAGEVVYYLGIPASGLALVTPALDVPLASYPSIAFFAAHGGVVAAGLLLVWSGALRPRPGAWWRVLLGLDAWAALLGLVDAAWGTNYLYLRAKPGSSTLFDLMGPWPVYLLTAELLALLLLWLLSLPVRRRGRLRASA